MPPSQWRTTPVGTTNRHHRDINGLPPHFIIQRYYPWLHPAYQQFIILTWWAVVAFPSFSHTPTNSAIPRLERSRELLESSIREFQQTYAQLKDKGDGSNTSWDLGDISNDIPLTDDIFDNAAVLEQRINQTLIRRGEIIQVQTRRKSLSRYVVNVSPLVKFLLDIGGMAAQVTRIQLGGCFSLIGYRESACLSCSAGILCGCWCISHRLLFWCIRHCPQLIIVPKIWSQI